MISFSNIGSQSPAVSSGNPWAAVMPASGNDDNASPPDDQFEMAGSPFGAVTTTTSVQAVPAGGSPINSDTLASGALSFGLAAVAALPVGLKVLLLGAASSAKDEFAKRLSSDHKLPHLHMGDLISQEIESGSKLGKALAHCKAIGENSPAELIDQLLHSRLSDKQEKDGFILDAYPTDFAKTDLKKLLGSQKEVKVVELKTAQENCPACIPAIQNADLEGRYFQVDDDGDKESVGTVLDALMENFMAPDLAWFKK